MHFLLTNFIIVYLEIWETSWMNHKLPVFRCLICHRVWGLKLFCIYKQWSEHLILVSLRFNHAPPLPFCVLLYIQVYFYSAYKLLGLHTCIMHNHLFSHGIGVIMGQAMFFIPLLYSKFIFTQNIIIFLVFTDLHRLNFSGC